VTVSEKDPYGEPVGWLRCFRGIDTLTAMTLVAELHDFSRFQSPRGLMAFLGLVPSENSTGDKHRRGPITKPLRPRSNQIHSLIAYPRNILDQQRTVARRLQPR
jgi:transposase